MYNTRKPSSGKTSKTNEQGQQQVQPNGGASGVFFVAPGDSNYCFAAALALRVGVDIYGGLMPESFQGDIGKARRYVKDAICGTAQSLLTQTASGPVSPFDQGFRDFLNPTQSNSVNVGTREIDVFNKCLQETKMEYTPNGQPTSRFFNPFSPRKFCEWGVDKVFDVISGKLGSGTIELYCQDFKYYSSETCANRVGCGASLQLVAPPDRPLPGDNSTQPCTGANPCKIGCPSGKGPTFCRALDAQGRVVQGAAFFEGSGSDKKCVVKSGSGLEATITCVDSARTSTTTTSGLRPLPTITTIFILMILLIMT